MKPQTRPRNVWTPNAMAVLRARYLRREESSGGYEAPMDMFRRTAAFVASAERGYSGWAEQAVTTWTARFLGLMAEGVFLPNSPTLMNAGRPNGLLSACAVLPVGDSLEEILTSAKNAGLIQKAGGGTGFSFSRLRPRGDFVGARNGVASGPVSFMGIFSEVTKAIQQGALRRGANMGVLRDDHPDIVEFINVKAQPGRLTNFNLSVAVSDGFTARLRRSPDDAHRVRNPRNGEEGVLKKETGGVWTTSEVFDLLVTRAWETGEPGVVFLDRMNATNPTPHAGEIEAVNACGEQPLLPYESCNLGSINLTKFVRNVEGRPVFDFDTLATVVPAAVRFLDNVVDLNAYPLEECAAISKGNRKIGLGVMGFADVLIALGMPYDGPAAVAFGERLMRFLDERSHEASAALARERGSFPNWRGSLWEERGVPMRNACTTTVAPTGSLSIIAGCSAGMEPLFAAVFERNVLEGRRMIEVNAALEKVARVLPPWSDGGRTGQGVPAGGRRRARGHSGAVRHRPRRRSGVAREDAGGLSEALRRIHLEDGQPAPRRNAGRCSARGAACLRPGVQGRNCLPRWVPRRPANGDGKHPERVSDERLYKVCLVTAHTD